MEKNRTFKHFFARIALGFTLIASTMGSLNANFYNAVCETKALSGDKQRQIHLISDIHMLNPDLTNQGKKTIEEITKDPENTCVMVELNDSCATDQMATATKSMANGIFCYLSTESAHKNIETINFDFRAFITPDGKDSVCLKHTPEKVSVNQFVEIIDEQINEIQQSPVELLQQSQLDFWKKLHHICAQKQFEAASLEDLYIYCDEAHAEDNTIPTSHEVVNYIHGLVDAKIIQYIHKSEKDNIFVIAGGSHLLSVRNYLEKNGYVAHCAYGISTEEALEIYEHNKTSALKLAQAMPCVDMANYFDKINNAHVSKEEINKSIMLWQPFLLG